jgi:hypothetical protein
MEQEKPALRGFTFHNIWALDQPPLATSTITGDIAGVTFDNVKYGQERVSGNAELPLAVGDGAQQPTFSPQTGPLAAFSVDSPAIVPGHSIGFTAKASRGARFIWLFGDGTTAQGRRVHHTFPDANGTALDGENGAGRFRVLLHVQDNAGREDWAAQDVVAVARWHQPVDLPGPTLAGLTWKIYPGLWIDLPDLTKEHPVFSGTAADLQAEPQGFTRFATTWDGLIDIPADGGYTFNLIARDGARVVIDGIEIAKTGPPFAQVCGAPGNALRFDRSSLGLRAGKHTLHIEALHSASQGWPRLLWEGPSISLTDVPAAAFSAPRHDVLEVAPHPSSDKKSIVRAPNTE